ncbi:serine/threonine-protein kinase [uncultured Thiodictyon sp.]|uniref:ATP-binding protein n=1 Tax=uncultured Thiodictyon sp. TaxID=1846217 RepID=UPI0025D546A2|nr:serine/threonine-protein kinase [uncultured Thiodictyon sp.]
MSETEIHRGRYHRVLRVLDPLAGALIVKRVLDDRDGAAARTALNNERRILERLQGLADCPRLVRGDSAQRDLVVDDFGGLTLHASGLLGAIDLAGFLVLSAALAHQLALIHGCGVIHKDLNPANILVRRDDLRVQIIDFDLATTFAEEHPEFGHSSRSLGTLAYLSPEQTGRMNRPVDYRTDLYSLGATLYALATGVPPFAETDPLRLLHAHLARAPQPPHEQASWLPPRLSELMLMLLAKEPDDRYQSAAGLAYDLQQLGQALTDGRPLAGVRLRERDLPLAPRSPRRLYGRDAELATLLAAFASVTQGGFRSLFVAGYSGVGKTSLIAEIHRPVTLAQGLFITGKFEQYSRDRPFLAPAQGLCQLCQLLLVAPAVELAHWRARILAGVGPDAGALFDVVPQLEGLLGAQPPVSELGPIEAQVRLRTLLVALVRQVAAPAHPLVLFLDDLQWVDAPSLDFIGALLDEPALNGLLLIGAYRDNEVDTAHPLRRRLRRPTATGAPPPVLSLSSLTVEDLDALLADMLRISRREARPLAAALYAKSNGNPFFTIDLLNTLHREGVLCPDPELTGWRWDAAAIAAYPVSANVVDFLTQRLSEWALPTAEVLVAAACLGNACTLGVLALATGAPPVELIDRLLPALERGILVTPDAVAFHQAEPGVTLRF